VNNYSKNTGIPAPLIDSIGLQKKAASVVLSCCKQNNHWFNLLNSTIMIYCLRCKYYINGFFFQNTYPLFRKEIEWISISSKEKGLFFLNTYPLLTLTNMLLDRKFNA